MTPTAATATPTTSRSTGSAALAGRSGRHAGRARGDDRPRADAHGVELAASLGYEVPPEFTPETFDMWYTPAEVITHAVDVSAHLEQKRAAMEAHASQATAADPSGDPQPRAVPRPARRVLRPGLRHRVVRRAAAGPPARPADDVFASLVSAVVTIDPPGSASEPVVRPAHRTTTGPTSPRSTSTTRSSRPIPREAVEHELHRKSLQRRVDRGARVARGPGRAVRLGHPQGVGRHLQPAWPTSSTT